MTVQIIRGDARDLPLADDSVDLVVTSPPYFGLRSYQDGGEHYDGQIGDEPTPAEFVDALIDCTREWARVLKPMGSMWINLGDKYATAGGGSNNGAKTGTLLSTSAAVGSGMARHTERPPAGIPTKSLIGIPWRYALRCIDDLGLILRAEVIWSKPNGLPESVTDRVRRSHEQWFHFTLSPRYFSAVDEIREGYTAPPFRGQKVHKATAGGQTGNPSIGTWDASDYQHNPLGKLPGSVWTVPTQPLTVPAHLGVDHFAAFPMEWPRRIIRGWSPSGVCVECGEPRTDVYEATGLSTYARLKAAGDMTLGRDVGAISEPGNSGQTKDGNGKAVTYEAKPKRHVGYACACPEPTADTRPAVVLDPFGGTGTTALVADALGRHGIHVDMSQDYCRLAQWRITDPGERARARQVDKPKPEVHGQTDLFGEEIA